MRFYKNTLAAVAALALVSAPAVAQAAESKAKPRSLSVMSNVKRLGALTKEENKQGAGRVRGAGFDAWYAFAIAAGLAGLAAAAFAFENKNKPLPVSP